MKRLEELRIREQEAAREWDWLQTTLNVIARMQVDQEDIHAFRMLQQQAVAVGQRRTELWMQIADLAGPAGLSALRSRAATMPVAAVGNGAQAHAVEDQVSRGR